jgi:hypothetical protein
MKSFIKLVTDGDRKRPINVFDIKPYLQGTHDTISDTFGRKEIN